MSREGLAVFLDRDGVLTVERSYITRPGELELLPGAARAVGALNNAGVRAVVVSNQSAVARGLMTEEELAAVHGHLEELLEEEGVFLDAAYYCPNLFGARVARFARDDSCRKPRTGMLEQAARDLGIDLAASYMIGDQMTDIELARGAGLTAVLVLTGKGHETQAVLSERGLEIDHVAVEIGAAVSWILNHMEKR
jgi:D-glycero-D-manno-heptose 1,7-bisphosphate phosphatase